MVWYKHLYTDEGTVRKKEKIKWKICHNAGQLDIYVIALAQNRQNLLEIISTLELMQKAYPKERLVVIGLAKGYESACELACRIVMEAYEATGAFDVRAYLRMRSHAEDGQVSLCP